MVEGYCTYCGQKQPMKAPEHYEMANRVHAVRGKCKVCKRGMNVIVGKSGAADVKKRTKKIESASSSSSGDEY